jgi:hypothetical protein
MVAGGLPVAAARRVPVSLSGTVTRTDRTRQPARGRCRGVLNRRPRPAPAGASCQCPGAVAEAAAGPGPGRPSPVDVVQRPRLPRTAAPGPSSQQLASDRG